MLLKNFCSTYYLLRNLHFSSSGIFEVWLHCGSGNCRCQYDVLGMQWVNYVDVKGLLVNT